MTPAQRQHRAAVTARRELRLRARLQPARAMSADQQLKELMPLKTAVDAITAGTATDDDFYTAGVRLMWACEFALARLTRDSVPPIWAAHTAIAEAWKLHQQGFGPTSQSIYTMREGVAIVAQILAMIDVREHMLSVLDGLAANTGKNWSEDFEKRWRQ